MEPQAKKPRLEASQLALKEREETKKVLFVRFKNGETDKVIKEVEGDKTFLRAAKTNVKIFFEENIDKFWQYETFFTLLATEMLNEPSKSNVKFEALHEVMKLLTAGCVSSSVSPKSTSTEIFSNKIKSVQISKLFTQILEAGDRMQPKTRVLLCDLISGLCTRKEGNVVLSSFSAFVDQLAMCIASPNKELCTAALSTVIHVCRTRRFLKAFFNSNGGYYVGDLLSKWNFDELKTQESQLLTLFERILSFDKRSFGRQIAPSPGAVTLNQLLFVPDTSTVIHKWHKIIIQLLLAAFELREAFGRATLEKAVSKFDGSDVIIKYLCLCAHDAWGRAQLRFTGGLQLIMKGCSETFDSKTFLIAKSLNHFMHDAEGLGAIVRNEAFLDKILLLLQKYCTETKSIRCSASESKITLRPDSPNFLLHLEEKRQNLNATNFHCDFAELESALPPTTSNSPRIRSAMNDSGAWSPAASHFSQSPSPSPSPSRSYFSDDSGDSDAFNNPNPTGGDCFSDSGSDEEITSMCKAERRQKMGVYLLDIVDWFTHYPDNHLQLLRKPVFETLILLVSTHLPKAAVERAARSIKRLVRSQECLPYLLNMKLHLLIIRSLIRRPCLMLRYAERCSRCEYRRQFGREVIQELSLQANSPAGWTFMQELLRNEDSEIRFFAWSTAVTLIRHAQYRLRLNTYYDALNNLIESLKYIMKEAADAGTNLINSDKTSDDASNSSISETLHQARIESFNKNLEKLEAIIFAASSIVSHKMQSKILETETDQTHLEAQFNDDTCQLETSKIPPDRQIRFHNVDGKLLATVDREPLCRFSEYYRGMFENNFCEKLKGQQDFTFGNEGIEIKEEHFVKFLHLLSGCREGSQCNQVEDTSACISLIYLADKYLATELLDTMFSHRGIAGQFLTGATLPSFATTLVTALSTHGRFSDLFFLIFLRYALMDEITETLAACVSFRAIDTFCDLFKEFLQRCVNSLPIHPSYRVWI